MTIAEKLTEIEEHFQYWIRNYSQKELTLNNVRIVSESICKVLILRIKMEAVGTNIIVGKTAINGIGGNGKSLALGELMDVLDHLNEFRNIEHIRLKFSMIRNRANPSSHSVNTPVEKTTVDDLALCHICIMQILQWFYTKINRPMPPEISEEINNNTNTEVKAALSQKWSEFTAACKNFERRYQYILISPKDLTDNAAEALSVAKMPWRLVLDFDNKSDENENGLLYNFEKLHGIENRKIFTIDDRPFFDSKFQHYWFMANGLGTILPIDDPKAWRTKYATFLSDQLYQAFNKGSFIKSRVVVMINMPSSYANAIVGAFNHVDEANLSFVLCNTGEPYEHILDTFTNVEKVEISLDEIVSGIENSIQFATTPEASSDILIPAKDENRIKRMVAISQPDFDYLFSLGIEVVYKGIERSDDRSVSNDIFYRGALVSWKDLHLLRDIPRNCQDSLHKRVVSELERNRLHEIEFIHEAGAGGTTVVRRVAFDISKDYPTVVLRKYESKKSIAGLRMIYDTYTKSSLPLLIVAEAFEVRDTVQLHRDLANANKNAVIIHIRRGQILNDKNLHLRAELEMDEAERFADKFATLVPSRESQIRSIIRENRYTPAYISPFLYGLIAYDGEFIGLQQYIDKSLSEATLAQKKLLGFIAIIYHHTQRPVPAELFSTLLGVDRSSCDLVELFGAGNPLFDLLHEEYDKQNPLNIWRPRYAVLGTEMMKILLSGTSSNKQNWQTYLGEWLIEMIGCIKDAMPYLDEETAEILDSLFIDRIESSDGINSKELFTDLIFNLPRNEGEQIFEKLTSSYPNEAHFHGHFARYLYHDKIGIKNFGRAIEEAEASLEIQPNDPSLIHTLGMCYREQAENLIFVVGKDGNKAEEVEDSVKDLVDLACASFDRCIEKGDNTVYGHESQIRIILKALDFGFSAHSATQRAVFITNPQNEWYTKKLDKVGVLLEQALYIIEQAKGLENREKLMKSAGYIEDCEGNLFQILGKSLAAKDKYETLVKNTPSGYQYMRPHFRRMFVMCLLASKAPGKDIFGAWDKISEAELIKCVDFLSDNIFEDSPNPQNIRLWLHAVRNLKNPPTIEQCLSKVGNWIQIHGQTPYSLLEGYYNLYVLNAIKAINQGDAFDPTNVQNVKELKEKIKGFTKNEKYCFEWYGNGAGVRQMINHKVLGEYTPGFIERNAHILKRVNGRVKNVSSSQHGLIMLDCGLEAFFVPSVNNFTEKNKNDRIICYIGFRYDQIQAWDVQPAEPKKSLASNDTDAFNNEVAKTHAATAGVIGKVYSGVIVDLIDETFNGYIECTELPYKIKFSRKHLSNCKFNRLAIGYNVELKLQFANGVPVLGNDGAFQGITVRLMAK